MKNLVHDEVAKSTKFNTLKTNINNLENKIPEATTLIYINQYNTDKRKLERKNGYVDKKYQIQVTKILVATTDFWMQKLLKVRTKYQLLVI